MQHRSWGTVAQGGYCPEGICLHCIQAHSSGRECQWLDAKAIQVLNLTDKNHALHLKHWALSDPADLAVNAAVQDKAWAIGYSLTKAKENSNASALKTSWNRGEAYHWLWREFWKAHYNMLHCYLDEWVILVPKPCISPQYVTDILRGVRPHVLLCLSSCRLQKLLPRVECEICIGPNL